MITDVIISHPLTKNYCSSGAAFRAGAGVARRFEKVKTNKYKTMTEQQEAVFYAFAAESCGGLAPQGLAMLKQLSTVGEAHLALWPQYQIVQHMLSSVAVAIQRGNAMAVLSGYTNQLMRREMKGSVQKGGQAA
jgi:hypothetical protein